MDHHTRNQKTFCGQAIKAEMALSGLAQENTPKAFVYIFARQTNSTLIPAQRSAIAHSKHCAAHPKHTFSELAIVKHQLQIALKLISGRIR